MKKDDFFDRKAYLDIIEKRCAGLKDGYRQNLALIGDELVGKTSIVFNFLNRYCDPQTLLVYVEVRPETLHSFAKRFIGVLLYSFLSNNNTPLKEDLDFLIDKSSKFIPQTVDKIKNILASVEKRKRINIFTELLSLCEVLHQETHKCSVVIFDEFHHLEDMGIKNLYEEWSQLLIVQKNTMFILVSSMQWKARTILSKNLSLLFGNFEVLMVDPFDAKTSEHYLENKLGGPTLHQGLKNAIVYFSAGYPFYLNLISDELLKSETFDLTDALENLLFNETGILNQRFSNYLKRFLDSEYSQSYLSILYLISNGHNRLKDIGHIMHIPAAELQTRITHLLEIDAIIRSGDFVKINDRVFCFWLKFVHQEKLQSLTFDAKAQQTLFRRHIESMREEFMQSAQKPIPERITELLLLFEDEVIQIEKKRMKLARFREIKPLEFGTCNLKDGLIGRSQEGVWILGFTYGMLTEEDIIVFSKECKKYRHKLQRKIIVAFQEIDANARLRALEEKILTWDLNNLNHIMDLFSKPQVMV